MQVIMFHSVGNEKSHWYRKWLSVKVNQFEYFCRYLKRKNYQTLSLDQWYDCQETPPVNKNNIVLTFDDGYLDNWVYVYPILKKYGLRGTVFINPEFVDPTTECRFNLDDLWNKKCTTDQIQSLGFLSWSEIQTMDKSGVLVSESHSMSHNFYFHSSKVIDIYHGQAEYDWLGWFIKPESKPYSLEKNYTGTITDGYPVFEFYRALGLKRFLPSEDFIKKSVTLFQNNSDKHEIIKNLNSYSSTEKGRFETEEEMTNRFKYEIFESKRILEEKLKRPVNYLCWPGGGYTNVSVGLSEKAGYKASTLASREKHKNIDNSGIYKRIERVGTGSFIQHGSQSYLIRNKYHIALQLIGRDNSFLIKVLLKIQKEIIMLLLKFRIVG